MLLPHQPLYDSVRCPHHSYFVFQLYRDIINIQYCVLGFSGGSDGKESGCNEGDMGLIPGSGRSSGEENGNPLQYSCLENPVDKGVWPATVHRVAKSQT